ncbi:sugar kinase [uncultured Jannaschia sp.]|uniref:sugar kinase n=1 Tax=uncultured Jannaschia sp. TaxID=293347 RepID=UPI002606A58E|nr:sugar kinase [uncultured Jannaschia sp.]
MRIVSVGECMAELAPLDAPATYRLGYAGDTLNTAWYLARLRPEWQIDYVTALGSDAMSDSVLTFLRDSGIGTEHVIRDAERTVGLYLITLKDGERSFSYWRGQSAARRLAEDPMRLDAAFAGADLVYLSGITLAILEGEGRAHLMEALRRARGAGAKVAFDPNLRLRLWPDTATMCAAVMEAAALCDITLPSHDDEASHFGDADPAATRDRYLGQGAGTVVVKNGDGPILHAEGGTTGRFEPEPLPRVVDSTAAGDSFNAAYLAARLDGQGEATAIAAGCALAARVISERGALVHLEDM